MDDNDRMPASLKLGIAAVATLVLGLLALTIFRIGWVNHIDNYEIGYKFDSRTGEISVVPHTGYVITAPILVAVHTVDLRPMQVCINANARVLNCKLVRFNPEGLDLFLEWHGRGDYGQIGLAPILQSYAYEGTGRTYPFLTVITEIKPSVVATNNVDSSGTVPTVIEPPISEPVPAAPEQ